MPTPAEFAPELLEDVFNPETDFREEIGNQSPDGGAFSHESQEWNRVGYVAANKVRSAIAYFCGFATCDPGPPYRIRRFNPPPHPRYPWLYASSVGVNDFAPLPNPLNPNGATHILSEFNADRYAGYQQSKLTVRYKNLRYAILDDEEIADPTEEYRRFTTWEGSAATQLLQADNASQLKWAETSAAVVGPPAIAAGPTVGEFIPSSQVCYLGKNKLMMHLVAWPFDFVSPEHDVPIFPNFNSCVGKLNESGFLSAVAGTLLFLGYTFDWFVFPVTPLDNRFPVKGVNIHCEFELFDPTRGNTSLGASAPRGHNLMPWRANNLFYDATRDGVLGGPGMIGSAPFERMFYAHDDPDAP